MQKHELMSFNFYPSDPKS